MATDMYHVEDLVEVIETVIYTACLRDEIPTSIIIVGPSGIGKSKILSRYQGENFHHTDSISSKGLFDIVNSDPKGILKFLLMPDFNPTLSRKSSTVQAAIASLLSFTSDGSVRIDDGRDQKQCKHAPCGLITAATSDIYDQHAKKWYALGLRRRIIPIFFRYNMMTIDKLQDLVSNKKICSSNPLPIPFKLKSNMRPGIDQETLQFIKTLSLQFSLLLGKLYFHDHHQRKWVVREVVPIAPQVTLQNLAMAHAIKENRAIVKKQDVDFLLKFISFCDPEHPREI